MVFQRFNSSRAMTAPREHHIIGSAAEGAGCRSARPISDPLCAGGLDDKAVSHPAHLSGGQQQRVAIAPWIPSHALSTSRRRRANPEPSVRCSMMKQLAKEGMTIVVTHEMGFGRRRAFSTHWCVSWTAGPSSSLGIPREVSRKSAARAHGEVVPVEGALAGKLTSQR
jgi:ABC-type polar amino acid transport system ATPase subunit